jgi:hypothetical protein
MAETPAFSQHDPSSPAPEPVVVPEAEIDAAANEGPAELEAVLAAALDEDDLPEPHPPAPTPPLEAAIARPSVGSYGAQEAQEAPTAVGSYGAHETPEAPSALGSYVSQEPPAAPTAVGSYGAPMQRAGVGTGAAEEPTVATTLEVLPLTGQASEAGATEGGEWDLLMGKVNTWLEQADLPGQWERLGGPLRGLGLLLAGLLVIKLYVALLDTLDDLPLLPRLLQLVGLIAFLNFSLTRLTRSSDRRVILEDWKRRWDAFRGS